MLSASNNVDKNLSNPGYPGYENNMNVSWLIQALSNFVIEINFKDFQLEFNYDFLTVCNGSDFASVQSCQQ